jgi:hypothetical protein
MDHIPLNRVQSVEDLGLKITNNLTWDTQVNKIISKASSRMGMVKRCLGNNVSLGTKLLAYKTLVRPLLEYGCNIWSNSNKKLMVSLERVQRRATTYITNLYDCDYKTRLNICQLLPLSLRREFLDLVLLYNIKNHLVDIDINLIFKCNDVDLPIRKFCKTEQCFRFYAARIYHMWYKLPTDIRNIDLTDSGKNTTFKCNLKLWLKDYMVTSFDINDKCSWTIHCRCNNCRAL